MSAVGKPVASVSRGDVLAIYGITPEMLIQGRTPEAPTAVAPSKQAEEEAASHRHGIGTVYARIMEVKEDFGMAFERDNGVQRVL